MSENAKTITFVVVGLLAIAVGLVTRPSSADLDVETLVGENLTKTFDSPDEAKRLRIVRFDEDTATLREFEVAEEDGLWIIPSKDGYPADATRQMAEAATSLMDRKILGIASRSASDHEQFGVVDPLSPKLEPGQKGVGARVTMSDMHGEPLADLIIGKRVQGAEDQRYVREAGRDIIYIIEIDPGKLSTSFEDWIEKDLLQLNAFDLQQVEIKDYSAELVPVMTRDGQFGFQPTWDPRAEMTLAYDDSEAQWSAIKLRRFDPSHGQNGQYVEFTLAEDEELSDETLNDLKSALDDLQIVDVVRKPVGLSRDLKAGDDFLNNEETLKDLASRGFTAAATSEGGALEIISSDGEVIATMNNGTEYVLRFGSLTNVAGDSQASAGGQEDPASTDPEKSADENGVNRYLFVMARFNETAVNQPELEQLPELPATAEAPESESGKSAETAKAEGDHASDQPAANADESAVESADEAGAKEEAAPEQTADDEQPAADSADAAAEEGAAGAGEAEGDEDSADAADAEKEEPAAEADGAKQEELENSIAERKRIEEENQRKLDEYQETLEKGRDNVKDLNLRFGDWYFVVDDEVFRKVRLSREDVIKKKEQEAPESESEATSVEGSAAESTPSGIIPGLPEIPGTNE